MDNKFDQLSSEILVSNPYWDYCKDVYVMPSGKPGDYHFVRTRGSVMVVPVLPSGKFLMTKQFRYLNRRDSIEFPGGGIKSNTSAELSAREELLEETGALAGKWAQIGSFNPYNGVTDEICYVYSAKSIIFNNSSPDESEEIVVVEMTADDIIEKIKSGEIYDGMTITAFSMYYFNYLRDLRDA